MPSAYEQTLQPVSGYLSRLTVRLNGARAPIDIDREFLEFLPNPEARAYWINTMLGEQAPTDSDAAVRKWSRRILFDAAFEGPTLFFVVYQPVALAAPSLIRPYTWRALWHADNLELMQLFINKNEMVLNMLTQLFELPQELALTVFLPAGLSVRSPVEGEETL